MGKQGKSRKPNNFGKGKITPLQVAFIVDRYLSDNNYEQTLSVFRTEASDLISRAKGKEGPKSLLSLGAMLEEYICLKEQRVMLDQEKCRVEILLQGLQNVMHTYSSTPATMATAVVPKTDSSIMSPAGYTMCSTPMLPPNAAGLTNVSTPVINLSPTSKRKPSRVVSHVPPNAKKSRCQLQTTSSAIGGSRTPLNATDPNNTQETVQQVSVSQSTSQNHLPNGSSVQGSSVAKALFKKLPQSQTNLPSPKTPPQALPPQSDKSVSPLENSMINSTGCNIPQEITPTNYSVISSHTVVVSPCKQIGYYSVERSHHISSSPLKSNMKRLSRDHVKGRLDFNDSNMPNSSEEVAAEISNSTTNGEMGELLDIDIPDFDVLGGDFSISDFLVDIDLDCQGVDFPSQAALDPCSGLISGLPQESGHDGLEINQGSSILGVLSEKDMNMQGFDSLEFSRTVTKCIQILSPAKNRRSPASQQENLLTQD